jgi:ABC-type amino acid transport substrate-binding protein
VESYGMAISKDNTELLDKVNAALAAMQENGSYDDVYSIWFGE